MYFIKEFVYIYLWWLISFEMRNHTKEFDQADYEARFQLSRSKLARLKQLYFLGF